RTPKRGRDAMVGVIFALAFWSAAVIRRFGCAGRVVLCRKSNHLFICVHLWQAVSAFVFASLRPVCLGFLSGTAMAAGKCHRNRRLIASVDRSDKVHRERG